MVVLSAEQLLEKGLAALTGIYELVLIVNVKENYKVCLFSFWVNDFLFC